MFITNKNVNSFSAIGLRDNLLTSLLYISSYGSSVLGLLGKHLLILDNLKLGPWFAYILMLEKFSFQFKNFCW
jgi:hypothetical protein